jgi:meso-butanediol dehydrogenase / (S,S)-butanediol dehydrogenase / diacetyl reductase
MQRGSIQKNGEERMSERFGGKVAMVTGGSSGIGAATVARLSRDGAKVVNADRTPPASHEDTAGNVVFCRTNVTNAADVSAAVGEAVKRFGRLDFLVNNAGSGGLAEAADQTDAEWERIFAVNMTAIMYGCRAAIPVMRGDGGGAIVNIASISGLAGDYGMGAYAASKGAVVNYTRSVAMDCARDNIRVNALCPGLIDTPLTASIPRRETWLEAIPMGRSAQPFEMASVIAFLLSDDASFMTGSIVVADGGITAFTGQPRSSNLRPLPKVPSARQ